MKRKRINSPTEGSPEDKVDVARYEYNFEYLLEDVEERERDLAPQDVRCKCFFFNPEFTVSCQNPTYEFFHTARDTQAAWKMKLRQEIYLDRKYCESPKGFLSPEMHGKSNRERKRIWHYQVNGVLNLYGQYYDFLDWPDTVKRSPRANGYSPSTDYLQSLPIQGKDRHIVYDGGVYC